MKYKIHITILLFALLAVASSCDTFKDEITPETYTELPKQLDGKWRLATVSRNGTDITQAMDFSKFSLSLNKDNTYTIENYLPFLVKKDGTWYVDDPQYPFHLSFKETGANTEVIAEIKYPIMNGKRQITLLLSPGCASNTYIYVFEKVTE